MSSRRFIFFFPRCVRLFRCRITSRPPACRQRPPTHTQFVADSLLYTLLHLLLLAQLKLVLLPMLLLLLLLQLLTTTTTDDDYYYYTFYYSHCHYLPLPLRFATMRDNGNTAVTIVIVDNSSGLADAPGAVFKHLHFRIPDIYCSSSSPPPPFPPFPAPPPPDEWTRGFIINKDSLIPPLPSLASADDR